MRPISNAMRRSMLVLIILLAGAAPAPAGVPEIDICDCLDSPNSLGDFLASDTGSYPSQWYNSTTGTITIPLPADGKLVFDSFIVDHRPGDASGVPIRFQPNAANDPVRLLVRSDVIVASGSTLSVDGSNGIGRQGGAGGPGGFRGGDGGYELEVLTRIGGPGLGPAGGLPGANELTFSGDNGDNGGFVGSLSMNPLIGGSGGGGASPSLSACSSPGGGGGGGAILIAANMTITLNGSLTANGGGGAGGSCNGYLLSGGSGSAGAIHLVARTIQGAAASASISAVNSSQGMVRMQAFTNTFPVENSNPVARRTDDPGPVSQPLTPRLAITEISGESVSLANGELISELPQGGFGDIDVVVSSADPVLVALSSQNIPGGTSVQVAAKPRTGGDPIVISAPLGNCNGQGVCSANVMLDLNPGTYFMEARALFK